MNQLRTQLFQIKNTFLPIKQYKDKCLQFDEKLSQYIDGNNIEYFYLRRLLIDMEDLKIGSSKTVSKALNILFHKEKDDIIKQQKVLTLAALNNLCNQVEATIDIKQITAQNLQPNFLLYMALTENDALVDLCKADKLKNLRMYYYLQYMCPNEFNFIRNDTVQSESSRQKEYEKEIKEKYFKEHRIGLYKCDFYLPNSKTIIEVNGHTHYIHFKERRSGLYQQKYNYLLKKGYKVLEVE